MKLLVWLLSVMVNLEGYKIKCCLQHERDGLLQIMSYFFSINNGASNPFPTWAVGDEKSDCCEWERVNCSPSTGHVTHIFLNSTVSPYEACTLNMTVFHPFQELSTLDLSSNMIGSLVQSEGVPMLMNLQDLDLSANDALSYLPDFIFNLSSLRVLDLSGCGLKGTLDARLCKLRNIRELYFPFNQLNGSLPACLWNLTSLQVLEVSYNSISGNLPSSINLPSLEWLSIRDNNFQGKFSFNSLTNHSSLKCLMLSNNARLQVEIEESQIPSTMQLQLLGLANCNLSIQTKNLQKFLSFQSNLRYIDLSSNSLIGSFPTWLLQNNSDLKLLNLGNNSLTGGLQLPRPRNQSLVFLDISSNQLSGKIPHHIGMTLSALKLFKMSNNVFHGLTPSSLSNLTQLRFLDLSNNKLFGEAPKQLFSYCSYLKFLALSNNILDGEIIPSNMNLSSLEMLSLDGNHFDGTVKESLKISKSLLNLDISNNKAIGKLPSWIGSLSQLGIMSLTGNQFHGNIPSQICNMENLSYLDLSENKFTGKIPSCGVPSGLYFLHLNGNSFTGSIPLGLKRCSYLKVLDLANNQLSGGIPRWINVISDLDILLLGDNQLQGELPIQLCQLRHLNIFDVSNNNISGAILPCFQNSSFGVLPGDFASDYGNTIGFPELQLDTLFNLKNQDFLEDDENIYYDRFLEVDFIVKNRYASYKSDVLTIMSTLDLSCNQLTGVIPPQLGDLQMIYALNFSHNRLSGPIPKSFSKLRSLESLDLSHNNLSGAIPLELVDLNFLGTFNVSYNNLSGQVPETGQFRTFDESSYEGNPLLCGSQLVKSCSIFKPPPSPSAELGDDRDTSGFDFEVFFWSFGMSFITVLLAFFLVLYINADWRRAWFVFIDYHFLWWFHP